MAKWAICSIVDNFCIDRFDDYGHLGPAMLAVFFDWHLFLCFLRMMRFFRI